MATRDGKGGFEGTALDLLVSEGKSDEAPLYACGPRGMLVGVAQRLDMAAMNRAQISVEERMACGVGACRGCAVPAAGPGEAYATACREGPVFFAGEIDWGRF
jgi:dihydroorotate dehydrogenase electron transfer subunit